MENISIYILIAYHFIFFGSAYFNPMSLARSELLSTFFPSAIYLGRSKGIPKSDPYYWLNYTAHPVLSTFYLPHLIMCKVISRLSLDWAFRVMVYVVTLHHIVGSIGWYLVAMHLTHNVEFSVLCAITASYSGYNIKQQPCIVYTLAIVPWIIHGVLVHSWLTPIFIGLLLCAGYYPISIQLAIPIISFTPPLYLLLGAIYGSLQLFTFIKYLPKTIRTHKHDNLGTVPFWHILSIVCPTFFRYNISGVGHWEMSYYIGITITIGAISGLHLNIVPLILIGISLSLMFGLFSKHLPRIPARWAYSFQGLLAYAGLNHIYHLNFDSTLLVLLTLIQCVDLYVHNSSLIVTRPFSELPQKPSQAFNTPLTRYLETHLGNNRVSGLPYPLFTGHINKFRTLGYSGGMQNKLMAKWRNDNNPNGSGDHDYFKTNNDNELLTRYRVKFAYSRKRLDWKCTEVRDLYINPRMCE